MPPEVPDGQLPVHRTNGEIVQLSGEDGVLLGMFSSVGVATAIVAEASRSGIAFELVRNGSRGAFWLDPLIETWDGERRRAFGPVGRADVAGLFEAGFPGPCEHPLALGDPAEIEWLKNQQRVTFARAGVTDPLSIKDYEAFDGFVGLRNALEMSGQEIGDSGLVRAEISRVSSRIEELVKAIEDPSAALSATMRANREYGELKSYIKGLRFSLGEIDV